MTEAKHSPLPDQFIWRLEYADCSALEVMPNGQAFLVKPDGARHEAQGFITNKIARWYYPDIRSAMDVAEKVTSLHHELVAALEDIAGLKSGSKFAKAQSIASSALQKARQP